MPDMYGEQTREEILEDLKDKFSGFEVEKTQFGFCLTIPSNGLECEYVDDFVLAVEKLTGACEVETGLTSSNRVTMWFEFPETIFSDSYVKEWR